MPSEVGLSDGEPAGCQGYGWARHPNATIWLWTHCNLGKGGSYFLFLSTFAWATLRYLEILDENHMKRLQLLHIQNHESGSLVSHATSCNYQLYILKNSGLLQWGSDLQVFIFKVAIVAAVTQSLEQNTCITSSPYPHRWILASLQ